MWCFILCESKQLDHIYTATCSNLTTNVGTMFYMAPEMFSEHGRYNITVDTWSTGCSLVEMLTETLHRRDLNHRDS